MKFRLIESVNDIYSVELNSDMTDITFYILSEDKEKLKANEKDVMDHLKYFIGIGLDSEEADKTFETRHQEFNKWLAANHYIYLCDEDDPDDLEYYDGVYTYKGRNIVNVYRVHFRF